MARSKKRAGVTYVSVSGITASQHACSVEINDWFNQQARKR
jgi:hypothetical protein